MRILFIFLFLLIFQSGYSQAVGYLGKKILVGYNFNFNPVVDAILGNTDFESAPPIFAATKHEFTAGYVFTRKASINVGYILQNNKTYYNYDHFYDDYTGKSYNKVKTSVIDINLKIQLGKFISPIGSYFEMAYGFCKTGMDESDALVTFSDYFNSNPVTYDGTGSYVKYKRVSVGVGNRKMITDLIYFNMGVKLNKNFGYENYKNPAVSNFNTAIFTYLQESVRPYNWMEIKFGIGILF